MSKILITGHRGWIGTNFTKLLDQQGMVWIGIDKKENYDLSRSFWPFHEMVEDCDIVVHLAATPRIPASWQQSDWYRTNNVSVTDRIARACTDRKKYLVFASSSSVYGNGQGPLNPYAWTKLAGEQSIEMYGRAKDLDYCIARIFTNYGEDDASGLVLGKWLDLHRKGRPLPVRGDGTQSRDFIHVSDTAKALLAICQHLPRQQTLDIGTGQGHRLLDIAEIFNSTLEFESELEGYATATCANIDKTQQLIHWEPTVKLMDWIKDQLLNKYLHDHTNHQYRNICE